jgi:hypothetical protein
MIPLGNLVALQRFFAAIGFLAITITLGQGQQTKPKTTHPDVPDLSGKWVLDRTRSNLDKEIHDYSLDVIHDASEIRFSKKYWRGKREIKEEVVVHTDGRFDVDPSLGVNGQSETRWRGQNLIRKITTSLGPANGYPVNLKFVTFEEWVISGDRQTLTRTITRDTEERISKAVFSRVR